MTMVEKEQVTTPPFVYSESDFDGYQSAPLLLVGADKDPELVRTQDRISSDFKKVAQAELASFTKESVITYVSNNIYTRMHQREGLNAGSYIQRKHQKPNLVIPGHSAPDILEATELTKRGKGTILQNELSRRAFGMSSIEYANLTIIGDFRKRLEIPMWDEVSGLVGQDATPRPEQTYGLQVLSFDRDIRTSRHIGAMRIGMKRHIGETSDGTLVKARTTAIVNMSPSTGVDTEMIDLFGETARNNGSIEALPEFQHAVAWLIESELPAGLVLARNETVYGVAKRG